MSNMPKSNDELILEVLREVLARQQRTQPPQAIALVPSQSPLPAPTATPLPNAPPINPAPKHDDDSEPLTLADLDARTEFQAMAMRPFVPSNLPRLMTLFCFALIVLLAVINVPLINGLPVARALPDRRSLIIRDGLVLKGSGPDIYVLRNNKRRWISSLGVFEREGLRWSDVNIVDDAFLAQFPQGAPIGVVLKCESSPHIYFVANGEKRWIKDIATFTGEGYVWDDVETTECQYLRNLLNGAPIPPDAGTPPQP